MRLWNDESDYKPNHYDKEKKIRSMENRVDNRTAIIQELWKMNDKIVMGYKDLRLLLEVAKKEDVKAMKKGLKAVSDELIRISLELKSYYEDDYIEVE